MFEVTLQRKFNMPANKLYRAWCDPQIIRQWFAPGEMTVPEATADVREGGSYRIVMRDNDTGEDHIVGGVYQKVEDNKALAFTWQWEGNPIATKVSLTIEALSDEACELTLHHSEFADQDACDKHEMGWNGCLANLTEKVM
ncbi:MAG: SRPBCC domain-containing protein [Alphaproteobacteria bacterium]|nr:SRPBCC domain-containing protein [Alphaproteobacteria bacterium]